MTNAEREKNLKYLVNRPKLVQKERREVAKILIAAESAGVFGAGEMNSYAKRITGVDIREEFQGVYEAVNVLQGIRSKSVIATEDEFNTWGSFPVIELSSTMSKRPEKLPEALEIIRSKKDVTNRLRALRVH